jgi:hypothetical protein
MLNVAILLHLNHKLLRLGIVVELKPNCLKSCQGKLNWGRSLSFWRHRRENLRILSPFTKKSCCNSRLQFLELTLQENMFNTTGFIATKKIIEVIDNILHLQAIFHCNSY